MKVTRRRFLSAGSAAIGAATVLPAALEAMAASGESASQAQGASAGFGVAGKPFPAKITIAAAEPVRTMRGGVGASFHAVSAELPRNKETGSSWAGSEWGGNPEPSDTRHWDELFKHAEWLGMDWCRMEFEQRIYEPGKRVFDWDNAEMQSMYRVLDWAERRNVDIFLQQMWSNVAWNAYPENADDPVRRLRSAPYSLPEWAFGLGELVDHLTRTKKYTCIKWVCINNEPVADEWSWWQDANMKVMSITPGLKAAREEFDRRGITVPISGPDWTDLPAFEPAKVDFDAYIGAYDFHSYGAVFDCIADGMKLAEAEHRLAQWAEWAHAHNKPLFLSEFGTMGFGWGHDDLGPACYQSGLKNASLVVRGINAGVDGFNRWSFTNRGDLDGQWQLVRTWDIDSNKLLKNFTPQPNAYWQFAMLSRFFPRHSGVLGTKVEATFSPVDRKLVAAALRTPKGNMTVLVVNESQRAADVNIAFDGLAKPVRLQRYSLTKEIEDKVNVEIHAERSFEVSTTLKDRVPPMSIVVYSTYDLKAGDPGLINE